MLLIRGSLIKWMGTEGLERVLCYHPDGNRYYGIAVEGAKAWPFARTLSDVAEALETKMAIIIDRDPWASQLRPESALSEKHRQMRDRAYEAIRVLVEDPRRLVYDRRTSGPEIRRAAETQIVKDGKTSMHITTIYKYLRRFWQRGAVKDALQPDFINCGGCGKPKTIGSVKLGNKNINGEHVGINVTGEIKGYFDDAIRNNYLNREKRSLNTAFNRLLEDRYAEGHSIKNGRLTPDLLPPEKRPTIAQFKYHFYKNYRKVQSLRARMGSTYVEQNCRAATGDQTKSALGVGDIYQIDATTADVHLVSSYDTELVVGRPIVYLALDAFSQLVTGIHVTFCDMSYNAVAMAIWNAYSDKVRFCEKMGVHGIDPDHWPSKGLPASIFADRGELSSRISDVVAMNLNIRLATAPAYCPTAKAIVERYFGILNKKVINWLPGAIPTEFGKPSLGDYRTKAALTKEEFSQALIHAVLAYNISTRPDYKLTLAMIRDHVEPIPCKIWEWGLANRPQLHDNDTRIVRLGLLPVKSGTVLRDGINFKSLHYTCPKARVEEWFENQKSFGGGGKVMCSYDPNWTDHVYLLGTTFADTEVCDLTDADAKFMGWTWAEVEKHQEQAAKYLLARENDDRQNQVTCEAAIRQISSGAEARRKKLGLSNVRDIAKAREIQKVQDGQKEAIETMQIIGVPPLQPSPTHVSKADESIIAAEWAMICEEGQRDEKK